MIAPKMECPDCGGEGGHSWRCGMCNGSGEGMADGTTCWDCRGWGEKSVPCDTCEGAGEVDADDDEESDNE